MLTLVSVEYSYDQRNDIRNHYSLIIILLIQNMGKQSWLSIP